MSKLTVQQIARVAYEVNRAQTIGSTDRTPPPSRQLGGGVTAPPPPIVDPVGFDDISVAAQDDLAAAVVLEQVDPAPSAGRQHDRWMMARQAAGWRYGPRKDEIRLEHPDIVPFEQLPLSTQAKDYIFRAVVKELTALDIPFTMSLPVGLLASSAAFAPALDTMKPTLVPFEQQQLPPELKDLAKGKK